MSTSNRTRQAGKVILSLLAIVFLLATTIGTQAATAEQPATAPAQQAAPAVQASKISVKPKFSNAKAFDVSPALRNLPKAPPAVVDPEAEPADIRPERGRDVLDDGFKGDGALNAANAKLAPSVAAALAPPLLTFEGLRNTDNPFLVASPRPGG